ncbi:MAG: hypothetical protein ACRECV_10635 [Xanthobacteraceae bacterium]
MPSFRRFPGGILVSRIRAPAVMVEQGSAMPLDGTTDEGTPEGHG